MLKEEISWNIIAANLKNKVGNYKGREYTGVGTL